MTQFYALGNIIILITYFTLNIISVGQMGTALPLLLGFVMASTFSLFIKFFTCRVVVRTHFIIFLIFLAWLALRVVIDIQDLDYLKQITIATTGGILLFYIVGNFTRYAVDEITTRKKTWAIKIYLLLFLLYSLLIILFLKDRLMVRDDIFYIEGVYGNYQRPGNFLIITFYITSFLIVALAAHRSTKKLLHFIFWLAIYSTGMVLTLISSQMFGSNAATANILGVYFISTITGLLAINKTIRNGFLTSKLRLPFSKAILTQTTKYSLLILLAGALLLSIAVEVTGFDLGKTRVFGFGSGENSSVTARLDIIKEVGAAQLGYAPVWGNINVAYLTTGDAGRTLHNFALNVIAELGLVGLLIVVTLFIMNTITLVNNTKTELLTTESYIHSITNFWMLLIFIFLLFYANAAVGKSWIVLWFCMGFSVNAFSFIGKPIKSDIAPSETT